MAELSPRTLRRLMIGVALVLAAVIVIIAAVYAVAFIILAPMMA